MALAVYPIVVHTCHPSSIPLSLFLVLRFCGLLLLGGLLRWRGGGAGYCHAIHFSLQVHQLLFSPVIIQHAEESCCYVTWEGL